MSIETVTPETLDDTTTFVREGVLMWEERALRQQSSPYVATLVVEEGVYPVVSWAEPPSYASAETIDKGVIRLLPVTDDPSHVVHVQRDESLDPLQLTPSDWGCGAPVVADVYNLVESMTTRSLQRFIRRVFSLQAVFQSYWTAHAGCRHHSDRGGLARHSLNVAHSVLNTMQRSRTPGVVFTDTELDLGVVVALLHDVGKTISYTDEGYLTKRALVVGHEVLGLELMRSPLDALRSECVGLADAVTALMLSRTKFAQGAFPYEAMRQIISQADRESAVRGATRFASARPRGK